MDGTRRRLAASGIAAALLLAVAAPAHAAGPPGALHVPGVAGPAAARLPCGAPVIDAPRRGATGHAAVRVLTDAGVLAEAAADAGSTVADYRRRLRTDPTTRVDDCARMFVVERRTPGESGSASEPAAPEPAAAEQLAGLEPVAALDAAGDPFALNSRPGSARTIYLDFTGTRITGTGWNAYTGNPDFAASAFDTDGDPSTFSANEQAVVRSVWLRVAEDYAPFDVNVTTQDPGQDAITRSGASDTTYGTRALITGDTVVYGACGCGGIAYVGAYDEPLDHAYYQPALVFQRGASSSAKGLAEAASHEVGHNLGLHHDGTPTADYSTGQGSWAPIMGVGYYRPVTQWSKGDYAGASNPEDDLAVIAGHGLAPAADDHGDTAAAATGLSYGGAATAGVIGTSADVDRFRFTVAEAGPATVRVTPQAPGGNLDVALSLLDGSGALVAAANPAVGGTGDTASGLGATLTQTLAAGTYDVVVDGSGDGDPAATGYSDYGSLGRYAVRAAPSPAPLGIATSTPPRGMVGTPYAATWTASGGTTPYAWTVVGGASPAGTTLAADGTLSGTPAAAGVSTMTLRVTDAAAAEDRQVVTHTVAVAVDPALTFTTAATLPTATAPWGYRSSLSATGGSGGYTFALAAGGLPPGLTLAPDGTVSGTATGPGGSTFTAAVTDGYGRTATATFTLPVVGEPAAVPPPAVEPAPSAPATPAAAWRGTLRSAVAALPVSRGSARGFAAGRFPTVDADGDCQDTRTEVLVAASRGRLTYASGRRCDVRRGEWFSMFDRASRAQASALTVVGIVPAAEAWASGAQRWSPPRRSAFANDLGDPRALAVATVESARARGVKDPGRWLPVRASRCDYVARWTAVKLRWGLAADPSEKTALAAVARSCPAMRLTVAPAQA